MKLNSGHVIRIVGFILYFISSIYLQNNSTILFEFEEQTYINPKNHIILDSERTWYSYREGSKVSLNMYSANLFFALMTLQTINYLTNFLYFSVEYKSLEFYLYV